MVTFSAATGKTLELFRYWTDFKKFGCFKKLKPRSSRYADLEDVFVNTDTHLSTVSTIANRNSLAWWMLENTFPVCHGRYSTERQRFFLVYLIYYLVYLSGRKSKNSISSEVIFEKIYCFLKENRWKRIKYLKNFGLRRQSPERYCFPLWIYSYVVFPNRAEGAKIFGD